jgi:thiosulfate/3-mercaptopyruvate sulfurtransferase
MGHIPGAHNQSRHGLYNPGDETMLAPDELRIKFAASGVTAATPEVIVYCNAGVSASYGLLALRVAGIENGAVYDGSWKDWGNDDSKPIE